MWVKVDDGLHAHRKARRVVTSEADKRRDAAPMGLWVLAASWAGQNNTSGWVPEHELDRWDDDWKELADRLVRAGFWWPEERDGEPGYGFVDWEDYNPSSGSSEAGVLGNHRRWHEDKGVVKPGCPHCPVEPDDLDLPDPDIAPESPPSRPPISPPIRQGSDGGWRAADDVTQVTSSKREPFSLLGDETAGQSVSSHPDSGGDIAPESRNVALPDPNPTRTRPEKTCASTDVEREFATWYSAYPRKRGKGQAMKAYKAARKKTDAQTLLDAVDAQRTTLTKDGADFVPYPATWLNGERWADEPDVDQRPDPWAHVPHLNRKPAS